MLVREQAQQRERYRPQPDPRSGHRHRRTRDTRPEPTGETTADHLGGGQVRVRRRMGQGDLARDRHQVGSRRAAQQRLDQHHRPVGCLPFRERQCRGCAEQDRLGGEVGQQQRALPQIARLRLREQVSRVAGARHRQRQHDTGGHLAQAGRADQRAEEVERECGSVRADDHRALHQPRTPVVASEQHVEPARVLEVPDQEQPRQSEETAGKQRRRPAGQVVGPPEAPR